jgi:hypothetical protein
MLKKTATFFMGFTSSRSNVYDEQISSLIGPVSTGFSHRVSRSLCFKNKPVCGSQLNYYDVLNSIQIILNLSTYLLSLKIPIAELSIPPPKKIVFRKKKENVGAT